MHAVVALWLHIYNYLINKASPERHVDIIIIYRYKKLFADGWCQPGIDFKLHERRKVIMTIMIIIVPEYVQLFYTLLCIW